MSNYMGITAEGSIEIYPIHAMTWTIVSIKIKQVIKDGSSNG